MLENACFIIIAYLIGSIPFGYIAGRLRGVDLREHGSCNIGATNAVRVLGKAWGVPVFFCDFLKGYLPLWSVIHYLGGDVASFTAAQMGTALAVMFSLVLGHTFTCFLAFKGGKGVATTAGCLFALSGVVGFSSFGAWLASMVVTRYVSFSSMMAGVAMIVASLYVFVCQDDQCSTSDGMLLGLLGIIFVLVLVKHRSNFVRIWQGTEPKAFSKKK